MTEAQSTRTWRCDIAGICTTSEDLGESVVNHVVQDAHLYDYQELTDITREELFAWIAIDQVLEQFTGVDIAAAAAVLSGQPFIPTRAKFAGATPRTSAASVISRKILNNQMPFRLPMITGKSISTLKIAFTKNLGAFVGRSVPVVGWIVLAYDVEEIIRKTSQKYNAMAIGKDKLW